MISGFVGGAAEPGTLHERVDHDLAVVAGGLVRAAGRADDPVSTEAIATLGRLLPDYAGRVEQARAVGQGDAAAGEAALRRASDLMQTAMLPVAETLLQRQAQLLDQAYQDATMFPVAPLVVAVLLVAVLVVVQVWMAHRFRRAFNHGLVVATGAVAAALLWWTVSGLVSGQHIATSQAHSQAISDALVPAQITALQARTAEALALVEQDTSRREREFDDRMRRLGPDGALGAADQLMTDPAARARLRAASAAAADYRDAHEQVRRATAEGRPAEAARLAFGAEPSSAATAFTRLDTGLADTVIAERESFGDQAVAARRWSLGSVAVVALLMALGIVATALGIAARLREYP